MPSVPPKLLACIARLRIDIIVTSKWLLWVLCNVPPFALSHFRQVRGNFLLLLVSNLSKLNPFLERGLQFLLATYLVSQKIRITSGPFYFRCRPVLSTKAAFTRIRIDPDIRMSELRIGLPSTRKRLKCTLSGAIRCAIRSCSKTISKVDHPDVPVPFGHV